VFSVAPNTTLNGRRVLVTDDRTEIRYLLRQFLEDAGADVITAANGLAAIDDVQKSKSAGPGIDMVVMDMAMPGVDGYETTRRLRDKGYDKPIVALTAGATREDRDRCLQAGCDAYLTKPVDRQAFVDTVAHYAGDRGEGRANEKTALKILLVDDHRTACQSMARLLEMSGNEVRMAFDGKTAIAAAQNFPADALILDIKLPDMSGYELVKRLKENASLSAARSIALTGYTEEMRDKEASENFDHFLVKPVDILRLEALLT
jgi:CheY-like chemotaxis protein